MCRWESASFFAIWNVQFRNKSLRADILIRKESVVEAAGHAAKRYKSTLAVFKLEEILSGAVQVALDIPKRDNKNQSKLIKMILMSYKDVSLGTIKLTVGVRNRTLDSKFWMSFLICWGKIYDLVGISGST